MSYALNKKAQAYLETQSMDRLATLGASTLKMQEQCAQEGQDPGLKGILQAGLWLMGGDGEGEGDALADIPHDIFLASAADPSVAIGAAATIAVIYLVEEVVRLRAELAMRNTEPPTVTF